MLILRNRNIFEKKKKERNISWMSSQEAYIDLLVRNQFMRKKSRVCILKKKRRVYRGVCEKKIASQNDGAR